MQTSRRMMEAAVSALAGQHARVEAEEHALVAKLAATRAERIDLAEALAHFRRLLDVPSDQEDELATGGQPRGAGVDPGAARPDAGGPEIDGRRPHVVGPDAASASTGTRPSTIAANASGEPAGLPAGRTPDGTAGGRRPDARRAGGPGGAPAGLRAPYVWEWAAAAILAAAPDGTAQLTHGEAFDGALRCGFRARPGASRPQAYANFIRTLRRELESGGTRLTYAADRWALTAEGRREFQQRAPERQPMTPGAADPERVETAGAPDAPTDVPGGANGPAAGEAAGGGAPVGVGSAAESPF